MDSRALLKHACLPRILTTKVTLFHNIKTLTIPSSREQARDLFSGLLRSLDNTTAMDEEIYVTRIPSRAILL